MRRLSFAVGLALLLGSGTALASTHSDYTKSFPLQTLKTFAFKDQRRISRDPLANNAIWASDVKDAIRGGVYRLWDARLPSRVPQRMVGLASQL